MDNKPISRRSQETKDLHKLTLIEYLSNPDNQFLRRTLLSTVALGFSAGCSIYHVFSPDELTEIEKEALEARRLRYTAKLAKVDDAVLKRAASPEGTAADAKLAFQRYENWSEKQLKEITLNGPMLQAIFAFFPPEVAAKVKLALVAKFKELI